MRPETPWIIARPERLPVSLRLGRRVPAVFAAGLLVLLVTVVFSAGYGQYFVAPADVLRAALGLETGNPDHVLVVRTFRLPRIAVGLLVGSALGVSGAILQGITRNDLAGPAILGINGGAGLAAVAFLTLLGATTTQLPAVALVGGLAAATLTYLLSAGGRGNHPLKLILVGIGLAAVATAAINYLIIYSDIYRAQQALIWLTGSLHGRDWQHVQTLAPWLAILLPAALLSAPQLNLLSFDDSVARGLGQRVKWHRSLLLLVAAGLAAISVSVAGTVSFVGFVAPHVARRLVGPAHEGLLPIAAVMGALLLTLSDLIARAVIAPAELPVGVVTALLGAPYFGYLLYRRRTT